MKVSKMWIFEIIILIFGMVILAFMTKIIVAAKIITNNQAYIPAVLEAILLCAAVLVIIKGEKYYKVTYVPITDFEVNLYENILVLVKDNYAWIYKYNQEKIVNLDKIKTVEYYDSKKRLSYTEIRPYPARI